MIVTEKEYNELWKEFDGLIFTPLTNSIIEENEVDGEVIKIYKREIIKDADEVYQEYLNNKNNVPIKELTENEILMSNIILQNTQLKIGLQEQQELTANLLLQIAELRGDKLNV